MMCRMPRGGEQLAQRSVASVAHRAVGHDPPRRDALGGKPGQRAFGEGGHGRGRLVGQQFAVDQPRVVIDDRVEVVVSERVGALQRRRATVAGHRVPGAPEARVALDVHVQQIAGTWPLVAPELLTRSAWRPRATMTAKDRVHRRVRNASLAGDQPRPPARALARSQHTPSTAAAVRFGERRGRLERSSAHAPDARASALASSQRRFHRCAVARDTPKHSAARRSGRAPSHINRTSSRRPAGPSRALACAMSGPSFCGVLADPQSIRSGPDNLFSRSQPAWAPQLVVHLRRPCPSAAS